ncbi:UDP-N-acetylglucosamine pyrophosphorylase [Musa troglodytarum]|uniref:UDP-N-acetylglucosamine pyrophosphorylase n=1 Tax=Musa troglodytarum TaxID=320322 RepID=A0A9E7KIR8_9LILI|nr:UDP-N-acetylglucosamine pyrophosphorylase [Musa troglodytarum]
MTEMVVGAEVGRRGTPSPPPPPQALLERLKDYGQEDAFALWDELSPEERDLLVKDIESLDLPRVDRIIRCSLGSQGAYLPAVEPVPESSVSTVEVRTLEDRERWWKRGLKAISEGKLAVVLLSGGQALQQTTVVKMEEESKAQESGHGESAATQRTRPFRRFVVGSYDARIYNDGAPSVVCALQQFGPPHFSITLLSLADKLSTRVTSHTRRSSVQGHVVGLAMGTRLGSSDPKGCFHIGLPSGKSLFQIQAERILRVQRLAAQSNDAGFVPPIPWYIMTSPFTDEATRRFLKDIRILAWKLIKFIMETPYKVSKAPDGNGGLYSALKSSKLLEDMAMRGVRYVDCYGVDNALVRVADPTFLGYFIDKGVATAAKVAYPQEKVGVFVQRGRGGPLTVVEYSEMDASMTTEINQSTGRLRYCWSNVCLHVFTLDFLNQVANGLEKDSIYHLAEKKIPSIHGYTTGLKLEQFVFDAFTYAPSMALFEVLREEEFAPVKNANGASYDTPDSARLMLLRLHSRWVVAAGGFLTHSIPLYLTGVEISPLCSYAGENLEGICRGRTFHAPIPFTSP